MDAEGGGTGAGMPAQPVRDGLPRLQGTERNTAALPRKGRGGGRRPFPGQFSSGIHQYKTAALPAPEYFPLHHTFSCPGTGSPEPTRYRRQAVCARTTVKLHILNISLNYGMMNYYIF